MPDLEISKLPELSGKALQGKDLIPLTDISASETKRIDAKELIQHGLTLIDDGSIPGDKVQGGTGGGAVDSVNGQTGDVVLDASDVGALAPGDNVSDLVNDAGYITDAGVVKIVAGTNVSLNPVGGTGTVTINATTAGGAVDSVNGQTGVVELDLDDLLDVTVTGIKNGDIIAWNGIKWVNTSAPPADISGSSIGDLNDVTLSGVDNGYVLVWDDTNGTFKPESLPAPVDPGVTKLIAGDNVTLNPADGTGEVTVTATSDVTSVNGQTGDVTVDVPTDLSDLNNDLGFVTDAGVTKLIAGNNVTLTPGTGVGDVTIDVADGGAVESVNGQTGEVKLGVPDLTDTTITGIANGDVLAWNGSAWVNTAAPPADISGSSISDLNDVDTGGVDNGNILVWNASDGEWQPAEAPEGTNYWQRNQQSGLGSPYVVTPNDKSDIVGSGGDDPTDPNAFIGPDGRLYLRRTDGTDDPKIVMVGEQGTLAVECDGKKWVFDDDFDIDAQGKAHGVSTENTDPDNTLVTKDYVDANACSGGIEEAPNDGQIYGRKEEGWTAIDIPEAAPMEVTAELAVSGEQFVEVEWGQTLRAVPTIVGGAQPVRITYQWWNDFGVLISDIAIDGATNATYEIPETKIGYSIWCKVTATDALGVTEEGRTNSCRVIGQASPDLDGNNLGDLGDINLDGLDDDYILVWDEENNEWKVEPKPDPGVTKIIAGTGIKVTPAEGTGEVTINNTISATDFVGSVDVTSDVVPAMVRSANALYVNTGLGKFSAEWAAVTNNADTDTDAKPGDFMMKDLGSADSDPWTWIDNSQPSTDGLWIEDSGKLYPTTLTNNVQIGGTAADPKISLNADGSATFASQVNANDYIAKQSNNTFPVYRGLSTDGSNTFRVNGDGSATFAGTIKSSTFDNTSNDASAHGIRIENIPGSNISQFDFQVSTSRPDDYEAFRINKGSAKKVTVFANGSAYFATDKIWLRDDGGITTFGNRLQVRAAEANSTDKFFSGASAASGVTSGSSERFAVYTDGSARFWGKVRASDYDLESLPTLSSAP